MRIFEQSTDFNIWKFIVNGPDVPTKRNAEGNVVLKEDFEWAIEEKKKVELNTATINMMHCTISFEEFIKVSRCKTTKEIRNKLQLTHERIEQVRETRVDMFMKKFKMVFKMENESINALFERFSIIINNLDAMGKYFFEVELVKKILKNFTKHWKTMNTAISEANDLNKISYDELKEKLLAYESTHFSNDNKKIEVAFKSKITSKEEESEDSLSNNEMEFVIRRLRKLMKQKDRGICSSCKDYKVICHHCNEVRHYNAECP
ncbi:hypothetical protein AHAS_Ahas03G0100700 [Arachis hypogaea]